jgi:uncharacterized protein with PIN domain
MEKTEKPKSEILQEQIDSLKKQIESLTTLPKKAELEQLEHQTHKHNETAEEHFDNCPNCRKKIKEKLKPEILKEIEETKPKKVVQCTNCGEKVNAEIEKCPTCGNREAREIS